MLDVEIDGIQQGGDREVIVLEFPEGVERHLLLIVGEVEGGFAKYRKLLLFGDGPCTVALAFVLKLFWIRFPPAARLAKSSCHDVPRCRIV